MGVRNLLVSDQGQLIIGIPALPTSRSPQAESMAVPAWSF